MSGTAVTITLYPRDVGRIRDFARECVPDHDTAAIPLDRIVLAVVSSVGPSGCGPDKLYMRGYLLGLLGLDHNGNPES